jgi:hypothetical protein
MHSAACRLPLEEWLTILFLAALLLQVWKVSRSRRAMRSGADPGFGSD